LRNSAGLTSPVILGGGCRWPQKPNQQPNKELNFLDYLRAVRIAPVERSLREDLRLLAIILLIALITGLAMGAIVGGAKWPFT
jgi:hypothetical protein